MLQETQSHGEYRSPSTCYSAHHAKTLESLRSKGPSSPRHPQQNILQTPHLDAGVSSCWTQAAQWPISTPQALSIAATQALPW